MSISSILTIEFSIENDRIKIETIANKQLSKGDIVDMVEHYLTALREDIKNEAN